jgi:hypothetical protein
MSEIKQILNSGVPKELRALFGFTIEDENEKILLKFNLWARYFFIQYFDSDDAEFHKEIDTNNLLAYKGDIDSYTDIAFRGASKTSRTKLFLAFAILNDFKHHRRYIKVLSADGDNSKQIVTDIYNMFVNPRVWALYAEIFAETNYKREERMSSFTTSTGVKLLADTVGTEARGALQENARPDLILFEDFETRKTLRSAKITRAIWDNMEEARTSLALNGAAIYNCNYISEMGNVHILVSKRGPRRIVSIIPIIKDGVLTWPERYTLADVAEMKANDDDYEGERLCQPSASRDIVFDRETLDKMEVRQPVREVAGFKIYKEFNPSHRYASGHDVAGGVGLDSSTSVFIDFDVIPCKVVGTFANNLIKPDTFGDEIRREADFFGNSLTCPERNNHGHATIARLKQLEANLWRERKNDAKVVDSVSSEYGWHTNAATKPKMIFALSKAVEDGLIDLSDENLIRECKGYTRNDLIDNEIDPRLTTRHFDLLVAAAIAWQMKDYAQVKKEEKQSYPQEEPKPIYSDIGI